MTIKTGNGTSNLKDENASAIPQPFGATSKSSRIAGVGDSRGGIGEFLKTRDTLETAGR